MKTNQEIDYEIVLQLESAQTDLKHAIEAVRYWSLSTIRQDNRYHKTVALTHLNTLIERVQDQIKTIERGQA